MSRNRPKASSKRVRDQMRSQRRSGTKPELAVRKRLFRRGLRYRVDHAPLESYPRRRADIIFTRLRVAVFIDGCFWHGCPKHASWPQTNAQWWREKIEKNKRRDEETNRLFSAAGWEVVRAWEHEEPDDVVERVVQALAAQKGDWER